MNFEKKSYNLSRRKVLQSLGLASAAVVGVPLVSSAKSVADAAMKPLLSSKETIVGVLVPGSKSTPYSSNFLNGLYLFLDEHQKESGRAAFLPHVEEIGHTLSSAQKKFTSIIEKHNASIVIGLVNSRITRALNDEIEQKNITFIEANLGENFFNHTGLSKNVFQHSMNLWQSHYQLGLWAAEHQGKTAVCATSFYDSGYDAFYAFRAGFEAAGGTIIETYVSGNPTNDLSPIEAGSMAASSEASVVFANYSGSDASIFLSAFNASAGSESKKVVASSMITQPRGLQYVAHHSAGLVSAGSWDEAANTTASNKFIESYRSKHGVTPDDFAVLGYDSAAMIAAALGSGSAIVGGVSAALHNVRFDSPRGSVEMNAHTRSTVSALSLTQIEHDRSTNFIISTQNVPSVLRDKSFSLTEGIRSGTIMPYPFV